MFKYSFLSFLIIVCSFQSIIAQDADKTVSITVSGSGKTQEEAKQSALRSAIEQAFGVFISSKTEIFNDQVVADQIASVSSGNIQSFTLLNESQLPNGSWGVTLKALVSVSKLTSFVEAKGIAVEIKGGLFAINIKQQMLNEQSEVEAVSEMVGLLHEPMQTAFDYSIKSWEPKSLDAQNKNWEIPLEITATANKNMDFCANYFIKTLTALSLTNDGVSIYKNLNKIVLPVKIKYKGGEKIFYLRGQLSLDLLKTFFNQWDFYTKLVVVIDQANGLTFSPLTEFSLPDRNYITNDYGKIVQSNPGAIGYPNDLFNFLTLGQIAAKYSWRDKRNLTQIEKMNGYEVKSYGVVSQFKHGGLVVYEKDGHGLVASLIDLGYSNWDSANNSCNQFNLNGYNDWRMPTFEELNFLFLNFSKYKIGYLKGFDTNIGMGIDRSARVKTEMEANGGNLGYWVYQNGLTKEQIERVNHNRFPNTLTKQEKKSLNLSPFGIPQFRADNDETKIKLVLEDELRDKKDILRLVRPVRSF